MPQAPQHREEQRSFPYLLAQLPRPGVDSFHLGGSIALGGDQRHTHSDVQRQFLLGVLGGIWQGLEQL